MWDIYLLINRALVYGTLTLLLALGYFAAVVVLQAVFQAVAGQAGSELVTVISTLLIAAIAAPLRRRQQSAIDRRFYRHRYDAARTLAGFGAPCATMWTWTNCLIACWRSWTTPCGRWTYLCG